LGWIDGKAEELLERGDFRLQYNTMACQPGQPGAGCSGKAYAVEERGHHGSWAWINIKINFHSNWSGKNQLFIIYVMDLLY
jgi:hypothetical protein